MSPQPRPTQKISTDPRFPGVPEALLATMPPAMQNDLAAILASGTTWATLERQAALAFASQSVIGIMMVEDCANCPAEGCPNRTEPFQPG